MNRLPFVLWDSRVVSGGGEIIKWSRKKWLIWQDLYTLHRPLRHHFRRDQTFTKRIQDLWQADLVDMQSPSIKNDGVKFLLICIDTFSEYAWVRPLEEQVCLKRHRCIQVDFERCYKLTRALSLRIFSFSRCSNEAACDTIPWKWRHQSCYCRKIWSHIKDAHVQILYRSKSFWYVDVL